MSCRSSVSAADHSEFSRGSYILARDLKTHFAPDWVVLAGRVVEIHRISDSTAVVSAEMIPPRFVPIAALADAGAQRLARDRESR